MLKDVADRVTDLAVSELQKQFALQGHKLTGKLNNSIEGITTISADGVNIKIIGEYYGNILDKGVPASRIPFGGKATGAKTSKYIQGLARFAQLRFGVSGKKALSIAFAIANKQKKQGMPTLGSFKFSLNGQRTGAINDATIEMEKIIEQEFFNETEEIIIKGL